MSEIDNPSPLKLSANSTSLEKVDSSHLDNPDSPPKQKVEVIKKLADEWDDEEDNNGKGGETLHEEIPKELLDPSLIPAASKPVSAAEVRTTSRAGSDKSETIEDITKEVEGFKAEMRKEKELSRRYEDEEEKIVADVDDILSNTDRLMSNVGSLLEAKTAVKRTHDQTLNNRFPDAPRIPHPDQVFPNHSPRKLLKSDQETTGLLRTPKKPSAQCEECYECFEDEEKLAWHNLNDH